MRLTVIALALFGAAAQRPTNKEWKKDQADNEAKAAQAAADQGKMAAVDKVVSMLESLSKKVQAEGEEEAASYNKFACFCKDGQREKTEAIESEKDAKASLTADINKLSAGRKADDKAIAGFEKDIKDTNSDMDAATKTNAKEMGLYAAEKADLSQAISAIGNALKTLKASKPSLLQLKSVSDSVREALVMADAMGLGVDSQQGDMAAFLQEDPAVEMENYKFHSGGVIGTLEKLQGTFRGKKNTADAAEVKRLQEHDMEMQKDTDFIKAKTVELVDTQKARDNKIAEIAENSQKLSTESANLLDDQSYLKELYNMCKKKAETWDVRSKVRADELSAITAAVEIVKGAVSEKTASSTLRFAQKGVSIRMAEAVARDDDAMDNIEEAAEEKEGSAPVGFLQRRAVSKHSRGIDEPVDRINKMLMKVAGKTKSTLLAGLASQIDSAKPKGMEKIKTLVEELIKRLQAEAANEATQKGWCDKSTADATRKQVAQSSTIDELNDSLAKLEADRELLTELLDKLATEIKELNDNQDEADALRKKEKTENANTVSEAKEGKSAVESAITILEKFYKANAKGKVSLAQKGPADDAPDAGFEADEQYTGGDSTGVLGMLDVIKSDFVRTITETDTAETNADQDHQQFTETTKQSLKEKSAIEKARKKEKDDADSSFDSQKTKLDKTTDLLVSTIEELLELKKSCVDTAMSYEERVARREEEITALNKALCILSAFSTYGPEAAEYDQCQ